MLSLKALSRSLSEIVIPLETVKQQKTSSWTPKYVYILDGTIEHYHERQNVYLRWYQQTQSLDISVLLLETGHQFDNVDQNQMPDIKIVGQIYLITVACNTGQSLSWRDYQPSLGHPRWSSASPSQPEIIQELMHYSPPPGSSLGTQCWCRNSLVEEKPSISDQWVWLVI